MSSKRGMAIAGALALVAVGTTTQAIAANEASKAPKQIVADASTALTKVKSLHLEGVIVDPDGRTTLKGDFGTKTFSLTFANGKQSIAMIRVGSGSFVKANAGFWRSNGLSKAQAAKLGGKWVKAPASATDSVASFTPAELGRCLAINTGTLSKKTINGGKTIVITDAGDKPGSAKGQLLVSNSGTPLPTRLQQQSAKRRGGKIDARCGEDGNGDKTKASDVRLSNFNKPVKVKAPAGAIDPSKIK